MKIAVAPAMTLIEVKENVEPEGKETTERGIANDRPFTPEVTETQDSEERGGERAPTSQEEQIHWLNDEHLRIPKTKKRSGVPSGRRREFQPPGVPSSTA